MALHDDPAQWYINSVATHAILSREEERALTNRVRRGDIRAVDALIRHNQRFIISVASSYVGHGLPLADLISEGNIGLSKAIYRYKGGHGTRLLTYASWWIHQGIKRALDNYGRTIRLPPHMIDKAGKIRRCATSLEQDLGRPASDFEVAEELGLSETSVSSLRIASLSTMSLEATISSEGTATIGEIIADEDAVCPVDVAQRSDRRARLISLVDRLSPRLREMMVLRFGLDDGVPRTLEQVGDIFNVTRERIRQMQDKAIRSIRRKMVLDGMHLWERADLS